MYFLLLRNETLQDHVNFEQQLGLCLSPFRLLIGGFINIRHLVLTVLDAARPQSRYQQTWCRVRAHLPVHRWRLLAVSSQAAGEQL